MSCARHPTASAHESRRLAYRVIALLVMGVALRPASPADPAYGWASMGAMRIASAAGLRL